MFIRDRPEGGLQESCIRFDAEREEAMSMRSSGLCSPEDVQEQMDTMRKCYREFREKLRAFLGIDKEHDVATVSYTHLDVYKRQVLPDFNDHPFHHGQHFIPSGVQIESVMKLFLTRKRVFAVAVAGIDFYMP